MRPRRLIQVCIPRCRRDLLKLADLVACEWDTEAMATVAARHKRTRTDSRARSRPTQLKPRNCCPGAPWAPSAPCCDCNLVFQAVGRKLQTVAAGTRFESWFDSSGRQPATAWMKQTVSLLVFWICTVSDKYGEHERC